MARSVFHGVNLFIPLGDGSERMPGNPGQFFPGRRQLGFEAGGVAILFTGFEPDSENGYLIHCLPKSKFTPALLDGFMQKLARLQPIKE